MQILMGLDRLPAPLQRCSVTIGNFDGLHLGHQALIEELKRCQALHQGPSVVISFDPHPMEVLRPEIPFSPLFPRADLVEQVRGRGVDVLVFEPFSRQYAQQSAGEFLHQRLLPSLQPKAVVIGHDFAFGAGREGGLASLKEAGRQFHFEVLSVPPVEVAEKLVSSSRIREALQTGLPEMAAELLGRPFYSQGVVSSGAGRGRQIGFPTANLSFGKYLIPKSGVYVTRTQVLGRPELWLSVSNLGRAPTVQTEGELRLETHLLDQTQELYGCEIRVEYLSYVRDEKRFASVEELRRQIQVDIAWARTRRS